MSIATTENSLNLIRLLYQARTTDTPARAMACEGLMPRFYFDLASRDKHIPDNAGKELETLHDADEHARKLIDKIVFHLGDDDAAEWKVVISNNDHDAQMIVPFPASAMFRRQTEEQTKIGSGFVRVIGANSAVLHIEANRAEPFFVELSVGHRLLRPD